MVSKYNNGDITNDDMRAFLVKMSQSPGLSSADKLDVQNQIGEFDSRIMSDKLQANYKTAPPGSLQQYQAALSLANFYNTKAASQASGTPAQSQSLQSAADWTNEAQNVKTSIAKKASQQLMYQEELKVNALPNNTSDRTYQKAQMYQNLYDKAVSDGDMVSADKYASYYQQAITTAQEQAQQEAVTQEKTDIKNALNSYVNMYHDGKINETQYLQLLADISPRVDATNDYGLINTLNRTTDTVEKNLERGGLKRTTTASGLPAVLGKGKNGLGGSVSPDQQASFDYSDTLRQLQTSLEKGKINEQAYAEGVAKALITHAGEVQDQITNLEQVAATNPNAKTYFNGKRTTVASALDALYSEYEDVKGQAQAVNQRTFALVEVPPGEFNKSGGVTSGKSFAMLKPIDTNNLPQGKYIMDRAGILHEIGYETKQLTPKEAMTYSNGYFYPNGNTKATPVKAQEISPGVYVYKTGNPSIKVYQPGTSQSVDVAIGSDGKVPTWEQARDQQLLSGLKTAAKLQNNPAPTTENGSKLDFPGVVKAVTSQIGLNTGQPLLPKAPTAPAKPAQPAAPAPVKVTAPFKPQPIKTPEQIGLPNNTPLNQPEPMPAPQGQPVQTLKMPELKVNVPKPTPVQQMAQQNNLPQIKIAPPPMAKPPQPQQSLSPIDWFKHLIGWK